MAFNPGIPPEPMPGGVPVPHPIGDMRLWPGAFPSYDDPFVHVAGSGGVGGGPMRQYPYSSPGNPGIGFVGHPGFGGHPVLPIHLRGGFGVPRPGYHPYAVHAANAARRALRARVMGV